MKTISVQQGSREWLNLRAQHPTASEAPAMMSASRYQTRDQLLHQKHTGITQEIDGHTQALFDRGHATEAAARVLLEQDLGDDLFPVTGLDDAGYLLASFDGITMDGSTGYEHKLWSERLAQQVRAGDLEPHYFWQLEQQILVGGLERVIFVTSDGTRENWAQMTYRPVPGRAEQLLAGWAQFAADLAAYTPPAPKAAPVVAEAMESLPAVSVRLDGKLAVISNLPDFSTALRAFIARIPVQPKTDQDFVNCESSCKALKRSEDALDAGEESAIAEMTDFEGMRRQIRDLKALARSTRLVTEKLVADKKEQLRGEIVAGGVAALRAHIENLNLALGRHYVPLVPADFGGAVKGKRSIDSMQGAVNDELARAKIEANAVATRIQTNLKALHDTPDINLMLFHDLSTAVLKAPDDFAMLVHGRMVQHLAEKQRQIDVQRERIRAEEVAKLAQEQEVAAAAARQAAQEQARRDADDARRVAAAASARASESALEAIVQAAAPAPIAAPAAPAGQERHDDDGERINLSAINEHLALISINAAGLALLGFEPVATVKASKLYRGSDLARIRSALVDHILSLAYTTEAA